MLLTRGCVAAILKESALIHWILTSTADSIKSAAISREVALIHCILTGSAISTDLARHFERVGAYSLYIN